MHRQFITMWDKPNNPQSSSQKHNVFRTGENYVCKRTNTTRCCKMLKVPAKSNPSQADNQAFHHPSQISMLEAPEIWNICCRKSYLDFHEKVVKKLQQNLCLSALYLLAEIYFTMGLYVKSKLWEDWRVDFCKIVAPKDRLFIRHLIMVISVTSLQ